MTKKQLSDRHQQMVDVHHEHEATKFMFPGLVPQLHRAALLLGVERQHDERLALYVQHIADALERHWRRSPAMRRSTFKPSPDA